MLLRYNKVRYITISALLCAIGVIIPMVSPLKIVIEPASFTLASHVAIFIAMFISPAIAGFVAAGTALGFFVAFPLPVFFRAATHIIFSLAGAFVLKKNPGIITQRVPSLLFSFSVAVLHGTCEMLAVTPFFFGNVMSQRYYETGFVFSVIFLVGFGTVLHSMVDFEIARFLWNRFIRVKT